MSQHRSLRAVATVGGKRNVLKRFERVGVLKNVVNGRTATASGLRENEAGRLNQCGVPPSLGIPHAGAARRWWERLRA